MEDLLRQGRLSLLILLPRSGLPVSLLPASRAPFGESFEDLTSAKERDEDITMETQGIGVDEPHAGRISLAAVGIIYLSVSPFATFEEEVLEDDGTKDLFVPQGLVGVVYVEVVASFRDDPGNFSHQPLTGLEKLDACVLLG